MRDLRTVSQAEFDAFVSAYASPLVVVGQANGLVAYTDVSAGAVWPDSLVASYLAPMPPKRPRATGWRIPVEV